MTPKVCFRLTGTAVLATLLMACSPKDPKTTTSQALIDGVLLPGYATWADSDHRLADSAKAFCAGQQSLEQAQAAFLDAQRAWAGLQPMLLGPLGEGNRTWQIQFWPDKKDLVARQIPALLHKNPSPVRADVEKGSVVIQGLSAYEYLLYDPAVDLGKRADKASHCALLTAIGDHQQQLSASLLAEWQGDTGVASQLRKFPNARYADASEALADVLRVQVTALDGVKKKISMPLGRASGKDVAQPYQAEAWRSGASLPSIAATLESAERIWRGAHDDGLRHLLGDQPELVTRIDSAYAKVRQQLPGLQKPITALLAEESGRAALDALYTDVNELLRLYQGDLARALGVQIGFNAHDGD